MDDIRDTTWRTSTKSGNTGNCLEAGITGYGGVLVRDTKDRENRTLAFTRGAWQLFTNSLKHPVRQTSHKSQTAR